jgi:hypothetical protein
MHAFYPHQIVSNFPRGEESVKQYRSLKLVRYQNQELGSANAASFFNCDVDHVKELDRNFNTFHLLIVFLRVFQHMLRAQISKNCDNAARL